MSIHAYPNNGDYWTEQDRTELNWEKYGREAREIVILKMLTTDLNSTLDGYMDEIGAYIDTADNWKDFGDAVAQRATHDIGLMVLRGLDKYVEEYVDTHPGAILDVADVVAELAADR